MRLTATDKAIGEVNMRRADVERAKSFIERFDTSDAAIVLSGIKEELALMDYCVEMLRSVAPAPKPEKVAKERKPRKRKAEAEA